MEHMYKRFDKMRSKSNPISMTIMMIIRLGLIITVLVFGKLGCDWIVKQGHSTSLGYYTEVNTNKII